jgi:hypothetical protein
MLSDDAALWAGAAADVSRELTRLRHPCIRRYTSDHPVDHEHYRSKCGIAGSSYSGFVSEVVELNGPLPTTRTLLSNKISLSPVRHLSNPVFAY